MSNPMQVQRLPVAGTDVGSVDDTALKQRMTSMRRSFRGYKVADVHVLVEAMKVKVVALRADLERAQVKAVATTKNITEARRTAARIVASANIEAIRIVSEARTESEAILNDARDRAEAAAKVGVDAAQQVAGILGYTNPYEAGPIELETIDEEDDAFARFLAGDDGPPRDDWFGDV